MTEAEFVELISTRQPLEVIERLAQVSARDRRGFFKSALRLYREMEKDWSKLPDGITHGSSVSIGVLASTSLSDLKRARIDPILPDEFLLPFFQGIKPDWIDRWVADTLEKWPYWAPRIKPLWENGLCERPKGEIFIRSYYAHGFLVHWDGKVSVRVELPDLFFEEDVWEFFRVEGGGEFSLAAHDKYSKKENTWLTCIVAAVEDGRLERGRVLDASLDALSRDFAQFRAGWYSRFHEALNPTLEERAARTNTYLALLASTIPPTVSFAMKALKLIQKVQPTPPDLLIPALEPALEAQQKLVVTGALQLLSQTAKTSPERLHEIACAACNALVSEDSGVQEKVIKLLEKLDMLDAPEVVAKLENYIPYLSPVHKARFASLEVQAAQTPIQRKSPEPLVALASPREALAAFLEIIEDSSDPFKVELAFDGIARFGAILAEDEKAMSPLKKRARQLWAEYGHAGFIVLAARMWSEKAAETDIQNEEEQRRIVYFHNLDFHQRNRGILELVAKGYALPMLSLPTDTAGFIEPEVLRNRLLAYRDHGVAPGEQDLDVALLRLSSNNADKALDGFTPETIAEQNFVFALGAEPGIEPSLLSTSAHDARFIREAQKSGRARDILTFDLTLFEEKNYAYFARSETESAFSRMYARAGKHRSSSWLHTSRSSSAWHSILCPALMEAFFGNVLIEGNIYYGAAYDDELEAFFRPGEDIGPLGATVLALNMGADTKQMRSIVAEAVIALLDEGRLDTQVFVGAFNSIFLAFRCPVKRFADSLAIVAENGRRGAEFACDVIEGSMVFPPDQMPNNYGALLELLYDQRLLYPARLNHQSRKFLQSLKVGGKVARFAKLLCEEPDA